MSNAIRIDLGRVGVWSGQLTAMPAAQSRPAASAIEDLGFRSLWSPESFSKEFFANAAVVLGATDRLIFAGGIANIWARDATAMINGGRTVEDAFPGRLLLGIGISHAPTAERRGGLYERPLSLTRQYLDDMEAATYLGPKPAQDPPVVLAALGPRMLRLAAERTAGAHPYFVPVSHTAIAREVMGPEALLAPEQGVVLAKDPDEARAIARRHTERYLTLDNYRNNLLRLGFTEDDVSGAGSDALVDAVIAWGGVDDIAARISAHFDAGADHVCVQVLNGPPSEFPLREFQRLAPMLLSL